MIFLLKHQIARRVAWRAIVFIVFLLDANNA